jgi:hypothetical protein
MGHRSGNLLTRSLTLSSPPFELSVFPESGKLKMPAENWRDYRPVVLRRTQNFRTMMADARAKHRECGSYSEPIPETRLMGDWLVQRAVSYARCSAHKDHIKSIVVVTGWHPASQALRAALFPVQQGRCRQFLRFSHANGRGDVKNAGVSRGFRAYSLYTRTGKATLKIGSIGEKTGLTISVPELRRYGRFAWRDELCSRRHDQKPHWETSFLDLYDRYEKYTGPPLGGPVQTAMDATADRLFALSPQFSRKSSPKKHRLQNWHLPSHKPSRNGRRRRIGRARSTLRILSVR